MSRRSLGVIVSLIVSACDRGGAEPGRSDAAPVQPPVAPPPIADKPVAPPISGTATPPEPEKPAELALPGKPAGPPGPAYFALGKGGVVRLDGGKFTRLANSPDALIKDLQVGGDGAVWVVGHEDVLRLEGDKFRRVTRAGFGEIGGAIDHFSVTADGHVWAATFAGVAHFDGKAWTNEDKAKIGAGEELLQGIAVDRAGRVWVASTHKLHLRDGGAWRNIDLGPGGVGGQVFFESLRLAPDDSLYALASTALLRVTPDGEARPVPLGPARYASYGRLSVSASGVVAVCENVQTIEVIAGGALRMFDSRDDKDFSAVNIQAVAADDGGRVWAASELGVVVLGPGDAKVVWPVGAIAELGGAVESILVVGSGPTELPAAGPVRKGSLTGKLLREGSPIAGVPVELCPSPDMMFTDTPCADSPTKFAVTTDAKGVWVVQDVPLGTYGIAVKLDDKWRITLGERLGAGMQEGKQYDTGSLVLD